MIRWDHPKNDKQSLEGVLEFGALGIGMVSDKTNEKEPCEFWKKFAAAVTVLGGYAPPGEVVQQDWVQVEGGDGASKNYVGGN